MNIIILYKTYIFILTFANIEPTMTFFRACVRSMIFPTTSY